MVVKAFPSRSYSSGMDLRDWFAGKALEGFAATGYSRTGRYLAEAAYEAADAMMAERDKERN